MLFFEDVLHGGSVSFLLILIFNYLYLLYHNYRARLLIHYAHQRWACIKIPMKLLEIERGSQPFST